MILTRYIPLAAATSLLAALAAQAADCTALQGCAKKVCELEAKVRQTSEPHAHARLQKALAEAKAHCVDGDEKARDDRRLRKKRHKIEQAEADARKAEARMRKAQSEGRPDKAEKYRQKAEEKRQKAHRLESER